MPPYQLLAITTLVLAAASVSAEEVSHPQLRDELISMREQDQKHRMPGGYNQQLVAQADQANRARLRAIVRQLGWPTLRMVGPDASEGAWLVVQHADDEPAFQKEALATITPLSERGLVPKHQVAYLHDRISRPQRYGTQGGCVGKGLWKPRETEEPALVDERRKSMGLEPLAEYIKMASELLCSKHE